MDKVIQYFKKGEMIFSEGTPGDRIFRILSGTVLVCKDSANRKKVPIAKLEVGDLFGEMYLFDSQGMRSATVWATTDLKVEVIYEEAFQREVISDPLQAHYLFQQLTGRLKGLTSNYATVFKEKVIEELPDGTVKVINSSQSRRN